MKKMMVRTPLASWAAERWTDLALAVAWLIDHDIGTAAEQAELYALGLTLHEQGTDWEKVSQRGTHTTTRYNTALRDRLVVLATEMRRKRCVCQDKLRTAVGSSSVGCWVASVPQGFQENFRGYAGGDR